MKLSLIVLYVSPPPLDRAAAFYGEILAAEPVAEKHGSGPRQWSVTSDETGLVTELYPATSWPHTATRLEFHGVDMDAAAHRLMDHVYALPEHARDGAGWWVSDPIGNTVVLLPEPTPS
ncbi:VOC family protein [Gordonia sp. HY285]|uniref:VOC family protein n=1 Tax=Gordonia liuliyuniae TaxID=2911517 RepID=A0ABS9IWV4_9ACTN|nr:VOC family protein [Gordonia liuliyuniae]MCF8590048.1 VOC family protein [Gordonia liuliyuniae]MCF8610328.1 VOC family protein [Gordonia liuliyuniae]